MLVAVFGDAHAHAEALEAVLGAADAAGAEQLWSLGDMVGGGPDPERVVALTRERCAVAILGNHDYGATGSVDPERLGEPGTAGPRSIELARERLSDDDIGWLRSRRPPAPRGGGDAFYQKRIPRGAPDYVETARIRFPSGRHADEICPTEVAVVGWAAQMGTITFHPWPVRSDDVDHPDELRIDLDPQPGTDFADAVRVAAEARLLLDELGYAGFPKTSGGRGVHIYVRIEPRWTFTDVRHAAIAFGREVERRRPGEVTTKWWKEERGERVFVDYNQNARDRTIASPYSVRPKPGAPVSAPLAWEELSA